MYAWNVLAKQLFGEFGFGVHRVCSRTPCPQTSNTSHVCVWCACRVQGVRCVWCTLQCDQCAWSEFPSSQRTCLGHTQLEGSRFLAAAQLFNQGNRVHFHDIKSPATLNRDAAPDGTSAVALPSTCVRPVGRRSLDHGSFNLCCGAARLDVHLWSNVKQGMQMAPS